MSYPRPPEESYPSAEMQLVYLADWIKKSYCWKKKLIQYFWLFSILYIVFYDYYLCKISSLLKCTYNCFLRCLKFSKMRKSLQSLLVIWLVGSFENHFSFQPCCTTLCFWNIILTLCVLIMCLKCDHYYVCLKCDLYYVCLKCDLFISLCQSELWFLLCVSEVRLLLCVSEMWFLSCVSKLWLMCIGSVIFDMCVWIVTLIMCIWIVIFIMCIWNVSLSFSHVCLKCGLSFLCVWRAILMYVRIVILN